MDGADLGFRVGGSVTSSVVTLLFNNSAKRRTQRVNDEQRNFLRFGGSRLNKSGWMNRSGGARLYLYRQVESGQRTEFWPA